jgi:hypothetical protein
MNIVKPLKGSSLPLLQKKRFRSLIKRNIPVFLLSSLLGTYLDLIMVGMKLYSFPNRPFQTVFSINLLFTLIGLPFSTFLCLFLMRKRTRWIKAAIIVFYSLGMTILEKKAEELGLFTHSRTWSHLYTFVGNCLYLFVVQRFHVWIKTPNKN